MSCCVMLCHVMSCYVMLCYVMLYYVMLCIYIRTPWAPLGGLVQRAEPWCRGGSKLSLSASRRASRGALSSRPQPRAPGRAVQRPFQRPRCGCPDLGSILNVHTLNQGPTRVLTFVCICCLLGPFAWNMDKKKPGPSSDPKIQWVVCK